MRVDRNGFMTRDQAVRSIWSFYWTLDHSRDRRVAPLITEPGAVSKEELERIKEQQTPFWRKMQLKAVDILEKKNARVGSVARSLSSLFTTDAERNYVLECVLNEERQKLADADLTGKVDPATGLPLTTNDIHSGGRGVVSGQELCMEAIVSPVDLAEAFTTWLPPCPMDENSEKWGSELSHYQSLGYKPRNAQCEACGGQGKIKQTVTATVSKGILFRRDQTEHRSVLVTCQECGGGGARENWDDDEVEAVRQNAVLIAQCVHELANKGLFDTRPIDARDVEMGDLVWERKDGLTIGFRLNWKGYKAMKEFTAKDKEIQRAYHVLTMVGKDVRENAPEWAKDEYKKGAVPIEVKGGTFEASETSAGAALEGGGGSFNL